MRAFADEQFRAAIRFTIARSRVSSRTKSSMRAHFVCLILKCSSSRGSPIRDIYVVYYIVGASIYVNRENCAINYSSALRETSVLYVCIISGVRTFFRAGGGGERREKKKLK